MDEESYFDNETDTTTYFDNSNLSTTTTESTLTIIANNLTKTTLKTCENVINYEGNLYVCLEKVNFLLMIATLFFILFILFSVLGNLSVILAILKEKRLRTPSSYLILSLAITDLIVGGITVPIRSLNEIHDYGTWPFGAWLCDIRVVIDKVCVYSSLLHVLVIAIDRYRTVSSLNYSLTRSGKHIAVMVACIWIVAFLLAAAPVFGWRDANFHERIKKGSCFVNTLFSLNFTVWLVIFVIPCTLTAILYIKVYLIIKNRLVSNKSGIQPAKTSNSSNYTSTTLVNSPSNNTSNSSNSKSKISSNGQIEDNNSKNSSDNKLKMEGFEIADQNKSLKDERKRSENKASNILILMTVCIIVCWSPFFTMYTISSIFGLKASATYNIWFKLSIWLGYSNSICNMSIYAFMNPLYSKAIKNLLNIK